MEQKILKVVRQGYPKHGSSMGKNMWAEISADIENHYSAERWNARGALLRTDQDRVPLHRHEVQQRGTRQAGAALGGLLDEKTYLFICPRRKCKCLIINQLR